MPPQLHSLYLIICSLSLCRCYIHIIKFNRDITVGTKEQPSPHVPLQGTEKRIYIAIDEFQQIAEYPEDGTEALLRSYIQFLQMCIRDSF